jgi:hypothetical protein
VDSVSDEFLASASFPMDEHSRVHRRNPFGLLQNGCQSRAVADDLLESSDSAFWICSYHWVDFPSPSVFA